MGKAKKSKTSRKLSVLDAGFPAESVKLGSNIRRLGLFPDFAGCPNFDRSFREKIYRNVEHLLDNTEEQQNHHPHHHLYLGEILVKLGYAVYGADFESKFTDEIGFYHTVFSSYANNRNVSSKYEAFRDSSLDEKLRVLKTHDLRGMIRTRKAAAQQIRKAISEVDAYAGLPRRILKTTDDSEKTRYKQIMKIKDDFYQLAAMFKGANGSVS